MSDVRLSITGPLFFFLESQSLQVMVEITLPSTVTIENPIRIPIHYNSTGITIICVMWPCHEHAGAWMRGGCVS